MKNKKEFNLSAVISDALSNTLVKNLYKEVNEQLTNVNDAERAGQRIDSDRANYEAAKTEELAKILNDNLATFRKLPEYKKALADKVKKVNAQIVGSVYTSIAKGSSDPMKDLLTLGYIDQYAVRKSDTDKELSAIKLDGFAVVDPIEYEKQTGKTIIAGGVSWRYAVENLRYNMTATDAGEVRGNKEDSKVDYGLPKYIFDTGHTDDEKKHEVLKTKGDVRRALQEVIDKLYFESYVGEDGKKDETKNAVKVINQDAAFLMRAFSRDGGKDKLVTKNASGMRNLIVRIAHRIITSGSYDVDYEKSK